MTDKTDQIQTVTTYYLEMLSPSSLDSKDLPTEMRVTECVCKQYQFNKFLYSFIGEPWQWTDKLSWTDEMWENYVNNGNLRTWVAYVDGAIAGYYELLREGDDIEIIYFGLAESFIGKGLGGPLLSRAIRDAWQWHPHRVWVHTCSLDHPSALQNYISRGMAIYKEEVEPGELTPPVD